MSNHRDQELREELTTCKHFLVDSELVRGRKHVFNIASNRIDSSFLKDKLQHVYENLQCAAKINMALGLVLRNVEDGKYRYFYAHENNLLVERSQLIANKENLLELQKSVDEVNIVKLSTREKFHQVEVLICYERDIFCSLTQKHFCWLQRCFITTSLSQTCRRQLPHL